MTVIGLSDIIGLMGVTLLITTYGLLQFDCIDPKGFWYSFNNMIVAILVTLASVTYYVVTVVPTYFEKLL